MSFLLKFTEQVMVELEIEGEDFWLHVLGTLTYSSSNFNLSLGPSCLGLPLFNVKGRIQLILSDT